MEQMKSLNLIRIILHPFARSISHLAPHYHPIAPHLLSKNDMRSLCLILNRNEIEVTNVKESTRGIDLYFAIAFLISTGIPATPMIVSDSPNAFSLTFIAFLEYEIIVGRYLPFEGVIRTMYIPNESVCSVHTMLRVIVNIAVAVRVMSTNYLTFTSAFTAYSCSLVISCGLSLSLVSCEDWSAIETTIFFLRKLRIRTSPHNSPTASISKEIYTNFSFFI